ncbi:MAG TPA: catalase [Bacteroidota bacterium]|nr:catalase [Bacteroidota bacterium]
MAKSKTKQKETNAKLGSLSAFHEDGAGEYLTTNEGLRINDDQNSLKAGDRGPTLLEDFLLREKLTHFDHERIPERIVHARGEGAHGVFQVYKSMAAVTKAGFLQDPAKKTPVFVRFSTVAGSRGSSDLARDVRGFAVKFYTEEGNYDLVGNNIPVFFIQDAAKFPDFVHSVKPEPHHEMPQAASAHDTFWDFISLMPESMHMIMWVMSDRALPRSLRMMEGFGVHTFRFINDRNESRFVKFHWKPLLGVHSMLWDEAQKVSGKDPDFHRRDLWQAIENCDYPEWEFGVQIIEEKDQDAFGFDLFDATKLVPEELVPVQRIGKLTLNRNPDNFFAETEQVAFNPGHLVPGIDLTDDPLLQGRLFSYTDTQLIRLGGPNNSEIPINRPINAVHNNMRDGHTRQMINKGPVSYEPNSLGGNCPVQMKQSMGGFSTYARQEINAPKVRGRSRSFFDHFSQAALFYNSQSETEKMHIIDALRFELGKVDKLSIRERMTGMLAYVDRNLADRVAEGLGISMPVKIEMPLNQGIPADATQDEYEPETERKKKEPSAALSMVKTFVPEVKTRSVAFLAGDGVDADTLAAMSSALTDAGAYVKLVAPHLGRIAGADGAALPVDCSLLTASSVLFDAVYIPGGKKSVSKLLSEPEAIAFVAEAYKHCKTIGATDDGEELIKASLGRYANGLLMEHTGEQPVQPEEGIILGARQGIEKFSQAFISAVSKHRHWSREMKLVSAPA